MTRREQRRQAEEARKHILMELQAERNPKLAELERELAAYPPKETHPLEPDTMYWLTHPYDRSYPLSFKVTRNIRKRS